ncbi:c-type cytochrome [Azospirillum soli]|uniref:c-type cytochrome n=1 Tax=Azospirillum soli TaxID=1304799 RepID=UPI001AE3E2BF|nr:cytochrome c [Azospirillum soli]MBP2314913.1 mono/diheme cytochrome c family protein [Azospirillum soli]
MRSFMVAGASAAAFLLIALAAPASADEHVKRGEYLAAIMDCTGCHTPGALTGQPDPQRFLAGSTVGFQIPGLGTFYPPNLTPDTKTGLGNWSETDIIRAVRTGVRPDGRVLAPVMPYHSYGKLTDADAQALAAYLKTITPVQHAAPVLAGPSEAPTAPFLAVTMPK